jgi:glycosyltransferase involved in cell wall biosynthesis
MSPTLTVSNFDMTPSAEDPTGGTLAQLPLVSIVSGFYNRGHVLDKSVMSLLTQTYSNVEVIIFDDCSTDDTPERLAALAERYPQLRVIRHHTNIGFARGLIAAIADARGRYIAIHGSGDISLPERIAKQVEALETRPEVGVVGCYYDNVIDESGIYRRRRIIADDVSQADLLERNMFSHGEVMFRRSAYDRVGGYRPGFRFALDYDLWLRMRAVTKFFTVKEVLYERHVQADGVSYAPDKFLRQSRYIIAARAMAQAEQAAAVELYDRMEKEGLDAVVNASDHRLQDMIVDACLRSIVWGYQSEARTLASRIESGLRRHGITLLSRLWPLRASFPIRAVTYKALGVARIES